MRHPSWEKDRRNGAYARLDDGFSADRAGAAGTRGRIFSATSKSSRGGRTAGWRDPPGETFTGARGAWRTRSPASACGAETAWPRSCGIKPNTWRRISACPVAGGVLHTLNLRLHPDEIAFIANHAGDRFLIVDDVLLPVFEKFRDRVKFERVIVVPFGGGETPAGCDGYEELLAGASEDFTYPQLDENEAAAMCYTSGTTGRSKGVVYSHRALVLHSHELLRRRIPSRFRCAIRSCRSRLYFTRMAGAFRSPRRWPGPRSF